MNNTMTVSILLRVDGGAPVNLEIDNVIGVRESGSMLILRDANFKDVTMYPLRDVITVCMRHDGEGRITPQTD